MEFPILYRKASSGAILQWGIETDGATINTHHGHVGGSIQTGEDTITEGKNLGRSNSTTPEEQAQAEALARWTKQKKRGYVESKEDAEAGKLDALIEGGILPMLAPNKSYPRDLDIEKAIVFPAFYQPKLDGMRCIAIVDEGLCTLWSRTRKPILSVPHIVEAYEKAFPLGRFVFDGELYNHEFRSEFEELISILRKDEPDAEGKYLLAEHHVYDLPEADGEVVSAGGNFGEVKISMADAFTYRNDAINDCADSFRGPIKRVKTITVASWVDLIASYDASLFEGYEGGMARNSVAPYASGKRSKHIQKMKEFIEHEFTITGFEEGRGKAAGHIGAFICPTEPGTYPEGEEGAPLAGSAPQEFKPVPKMTYARKKELFEHPEQFMGKRLTVRFKRWTKYAVPYIPTGRGIRDYE